jgi:hypothetical protein
MACLKSQREEAVTITQMLALAIGALTLLLSSELIYSVVKHRRQPAKDMAPTFRQVGTFGVMCNMGNHADSLPSSGSSGRSFLAFFIIATFLGTGGAVKFAWDETHPDLRSAYGRAYERCVAEDKISRWNVEQVERCIYRGRAYKP